MEFKFERSRIWALAPGRIPFGIHNLTGTFPKEELFILTSGINRAVGSVSLNIAEIYTGQSNRKRKKIIGYVQRSAIEVVGCLHIGRRRDLTNGQSGIPYRVAGKFVCHDSKI